MVLVSNPAEKAKDPRDKVCYDLNVEGYGPHPALGAQGPSQLALARALSLPSTASCVSREAWA